MYDHQINCTGLCLKCPNEASFGGTTDVGRVGARLSDGLVVGWNRRCAQAFFLLLGAFFCCCLWWFSNCLTTSFLLVQQLLFFCFCLVVMYIHSFSTSCAGWVSIIYADSKNILYYPILYSMEIAKLF